MSLIKLAKILSSRQTNSILRNMQKAGLSTLAHSEANLRKGLTPGRILNKSKSIQKLTDIHNNDTTLNKIKKKALSVTVNDNGTYNIKNIETLLKGGHKVHQGLDKIKNVPTGTVGTVIGATIGYSNSENDHKLKSTFKGALIGGAIGGSTHKVINHLHSFSSKANKLHNEYFLDNYWKSQLEAANSPVYQSIGKRITKSSFSKDKDMSLLKLAIITNPFLTSVTSLPMLFSARAARTGNPAKYFLGKAYGPLGRRHGQRLGLSALEIGRAHV